MRTPWALFAFYEHAGAGTPAELRWFWSVIVYLDPKAGIVTNGKLATLEQAKAAFEASWRRWLDWAKLIGMPPR